MEFDLGWLLLGLPVAFALGWAASRLDLRQLRRERTESPRAYFKGLNLLLNEQQDKAVDAFIEAVQNDPDTAELHFALGNLFRRRGEFERAVRVHEHLLSRADLKVADRARARHALAQDFMRAGLFDRAESTFKQLEGTEFEDEAQLALLSLYERARDWGAACQVATQLERSGRGSFADRIAHYECERALQADAQADAAGAQAALERALQASPEAARPLVLQGQRLARDGDAQGAVRSWSRLLEVRPASFGLVASEFAAAARICGDEARARAVLEALYARQPSMALLRALAMLDDAAQARIGRLLAHLQAMPTMSAAQAVLDEPAWQPDDQGLKAVRKAIDRAAAPLQRYRCAACGFEAQHWFWQCPGCLGWDTFPPQPIEEL